MATVGAVLLFIGGAVPKSNLNTVVPPGDNIVVDNMTLSLYSFSGKSRCS